MADVNVYESIDIQDFSQQTTFLIRAFDSVSVTEDASIFNRFAYLPEKMLLPFNETLTFNGEILQSHDRTEQRIALRQGIPDRRFSVKIVLESDAEIAKFENKLHGWLKYSWAFPLWPMVETHTATITAGDTSITVDTTYAGYEANGFALIWESKDVYDIVSISKVTDSALSLYKTPENTYTGTKYIMPCLSARCIGSKMNWMQGRAIINMNFRIERVSDVIEFDPDMFYDNYVVLDDPPISLSRSNYAYNPDFAVLDAGTGLFDIVSNSDFNIVTQPYAWHCESKQQAWYLRQLFHYINGQQKGLLVPTFRNDLQLSRSVGSGDTDIYIVNTGITNDMGYNDMRTYVAFRPESADIIVRKVNAIDYISENEEKITIDASTGTTFDANDYLSWVDLCRLADNSLSFNWYQRGKCIIETGLTRIVTYIEPIVEPCVYDEVGATDGVNNILDFGMNVNDGITVTEDETISVV